jgi:hypothetical protein
MAGLVPDINPDDRRFDILKAIAIAMDLFQGPTCEEHQVLLRQFQDSISSENRISDVAE